MVMTTEVSFGMGRPGAARFDMSFATYGRRDKCAR